MKTCSICGVSKDNASKFYLNTRYGSNLCNKHYLQMKTHGKITDDTPPDDNDKRIFWTKAEEEKLLNLVLKSTHYKEISKILNKSVNAINSKVNSLKIDTSEIYKNNPKYKAIYQNYDWCYQKYIIEGLNHDEMALEAGCEKRVVEKWCCERHRLTQEYRKIHKQLSDKQKDLIIGSMLGDGHIDRREDQPMFIVVHAENQKDYLYYKYELLKDFCNIPPTRIEATYREFNSKMYLCQPTYRICTRIHDCFLDYRNKTYKYLLGLMNEYSFCIWMLDDACRSNSNWQLCIAEYTEEDVATALYILKNKFNLSVKQEKDKRYLRFNADSSRLIDKIILRNIPNELDIIKYKITENNLCEKQKFLYIQYKNKTYKLFELCNYLDLNYKYVWGRLNKGFTIDDIVNKKVVNV
jgi:hypothetical protein